MNYITSQMEEKLKKKMLIKIKRFQKLIKNELSADINKIAINNYANLKSANTSKKPTGVSEQDVSVL